MSYATEMRWMSGFGSTATEGLKYPLSSKSYRSSEKIFKRNIAYIKNTSPLMSSIEVSQKLFQAYTLHMLVWISIGFHV